ncbi:arylsulfatase [Marinobacter nanhaiticus D15-8W]|uniref:Arylsulfatase n=1 Tax=Marinobacter nanhaiticus D15-8W TaxID=626887 RepID=N6W1I6_9GAMM|nr:arylsulfatase [Marinobacter nanhaiticus]ENO13969.1 arylsulfatase [Marinobacter nanhaiticus D15-8W]BES71347.1 arylsulfatase [Marinobacter nanhaiticus D15-8W]
MRYTIRGISLRLTAILSLCILAAPTSAQQTDGSQNSQTNQASQNNQSGQENGQKPNFLVIWGDDIGVHNVSAYNHGIMGYQTPNIDSLAQEGAMFTDAYAQQSCTAGRASFILGQHPFRTGLLTIGMPGSPHGIPDWAPTIADMLKDHGYTTGQFGKNHLGDQDNHLPTNHGFDEFFGNLYHLNAEEEPESYYYPKNPEFREKFGPRGVLKASADGEIEDTGPLTRKRMETVDEEFMAAALDFIDRANQQGKPFFVWYNATRMHVWTHLKEESEGVTGVGLYPDGMVEHDKQVGQLLEKLDELGIADNTVVIYSTDNGAETVTWPDGGTTPFHGEKGTTWEGGFRVPLLVKWPGVIEPGQKINEIISQEDWFPTFAAAVGNENIVEDLKEGTTMNGKEWRVHLDGYNMLPFLSGEEEKSPRREIFYFDQGGNMNAVRVEDWKIHFAVLKGDISSAVREIPAWPKVIHLRADPYEKAWMESEMYLRWYAENTMWTFVPVQQRLKEFFATLADYPYQMGSSLNAAGLGYNTLRNEDLMKRLEDIENIQPAPRQ